MKRWVEFLKEIEATRRPLVEHEVNGPQGEHLIQRVMSLRSVVTGGTLRSEGKQGRTPDKWRRLAIAGLAFVLLGMAAGTVEFGLRYRERHRTDVPSNFPSAFYRHERLGVAMVRNLDYYGWFRVNSYGFRGPETTIGKRAGTFRIMVVGGSTTYDTSVSSDAHAWPARLQHWLGVSYPTRSIEVINAGTPSYRVFDNLIQLQMDLFAFEPDLIILYQGHNDVACALADRVRARNEGDRPFQVKPFSRTENWLQQHSEAYNKILSLWQHMVWRWASRRIASAGDQRAPGPFDCGSAQFRRDVRAFVTLARSLGIQVVLLQTVHISGADALTTRDPLEQASWRRWYPYSEPDSALHLYVTYARILEEIAREIGTPFIATAAFDLTGPAYYAPIDPMHFTDAGADRMGRLVADRCAALGIVGDHRVPGVDTPPSPLGRARSRTDREDHP